MSAARSRSFTGNHDLLPANNKHLAPSIPHVPVHNLSSWTFGTGTVIWRIWPAVLLHTAFAAVIVAVSQKTKVDLGIPNVLLTLLGVVIGFVISLRVSSAYDRYWWGRCAWSDIVKNSRTLSRLIWIHVPPQITKHAGPEGHTTPEEIGQVMREKHVALELLEAFAVSLKHHLRGELGIYYEDLYNLVRPMHEHHARHDHVVHGNETHPESSQPSHTALHQTPSRQQSIESYSQHPPPQHRSSHNLPKLSALQDTSSTPNTSRQNSSSIPDPVIPPINAYGSGSGLRPRHQVSYASLVSTNSSDQSGEREPLLPSAIPGPRTGASADLVPFASVAANFVYYVNPRHWTRTWKQNLREGFEGNDEAGGVGIRWGEQQHDQGEGHSTSADVTHESGLFRRRRATRQTHKKPGKHRPRVAGDGENLPLEVVRTLSEWLCVLEARGTVGGNALGGMFGCISSLEDALSTLERILTTPLPFVYSVHISTVWLYLFFLPFQLADDFKWYTIPGTAVAAFFYIGFVAAGEEIEQPFGYDENDLDLDLFCREIIKTDIQALTATPYPNAPMGSHRVTSDVIEATTIGDVSLGKHRRPE